MQDEEPQFEHSGNLSNVDRPETSERMTWTPDPQALRGRVAVVAGATRGAGRGIATALGEAGATVICTGRSTRAPDPRRSDYDRPETIDETAELVTRLGGTGIAKVVDHLDSAEVKQLADDIQRTHGHIDLRSRRGIPWIDIFHELRRRQVPGRDDPIGTDRFGCRVACRSLAAVR